VKAVYIFIIPHLSISTVVENLVTLELDLPKGDYVIIPCTFAPNVHANYKLNVKCMENNHIVQLQPITFGYCEVVGEWKHDTAGFLNIILQL
jgi:hypothetical protein